MTGTRDNLRESRIQRRAAGLLLAFAMGSTSSAAHAALFLAFTPDPARGTAGTSPEGCYVEPGVAQGALTASSAGTACQTGAMGSPSAGVIAGETEQSAGANAQFISAPLDGALAVGGPASLVAFYYDETSHSDLNQSYLEYGFEEVRPDGTVAGVASGQACLMIGDGIHRCAVSFSLPAYTLAAGSRLRVRLWSSNPTTSGNRLVYGDERPYPDSLPYDGTSGPEAFREAGVTLTVGDTGPAQPPSDEEAPLPVEPPADPEPPVTAEPAPEETGDAAAPPGSAGGGGGAPGWMLLAPLLAAAGLRRRRR